MFNLKKSRMSKTKTWPEGSNVKSASYDSSHEVLTVTFKTGKSYNYFEVPIGVWRKCLEAESGTAFLNAEVKGKFIYKEKV